MSKPIKLEYGMHKGKLYCTQYACKNNYGIQTGVIHYAEYPSGCCKLENPNVTDFGDGIWGCSHERYGNEQQEEKISKCLICGKELPLDMTQTIIAEGKNRYKAVCCNHEGSQELKDLIFENLKDICGDSIACKDECGKDCNVWIEHQLDKINSLLTKVSDYDCDSGICNYVSVSVDDEVRNVFKEFGYEGERFDREVENGEIDLNLIGFIYGKWFDGDEGYLSYEKEA